MPCRQASTYSGRPGSGKPAGGGGYTSEAECLQACQEGACCEGTTCSVKPQCQCQGDGKTFKGVGTTCTPNPCECYCTDGVTLVPNSLTVVISGCNGTNPFAFCAWGGTYLLTQSTCMQWSAWISTPAIFMQQETLTASQSLLTVSANGAVEFRVQNLGASNQDIISNGRVVGFNGNLDSLCGGTAISGSTTIYGGNVGSTVTITPAANPLP